MAAGEAIAVAPHLSVGLGPMVAASIHVAASIPNLYLLEYQPPTVALANELLDGEIEVEAGHYRIPAGPGLGISISEARIAGRQV
jgi:galactonate dehydratase